MPVRQHFSFEDRLLGEELDQEVLQFVERIRGAQRLLEVDFVELVLLVLQRYLVEQPAVGLLLGV